MKRNHIAHQLKNFYKRNTLIIKILLSYFVIGTLLLSTFSYVSFRTYNKMSIQEVNQTSVNITSQSYYIADQLLTNVYYNFYQLYENGMDDTITNSLYNNEIDLFDISDSFRKLKQLQITNPLIRSIYIINSDADRVIYSISQVGEQVQNTSDFFDQDLMLRLNREGKSTANLYFARKVHYVINEQQVTENLVTLIFSNIQKNSSHGSALVVNLNQEVFQNMVTIGNSGDLNQVLILYENGTILSHSNTFSINTDFSTENFAKQILQSKNTSGSFMTKIQGKQSLVSYIKATHLGLVFVGIGEYDRLLSATFSEQKTLLILTMIFIFVGGIMAVFFASNIYNPFKKLLKDIQQRGKGQKRAISVDLCDYLKYTFHEMADIVDKYNSDSNILINNKKKAFLEKILNGNIDNEIRNRDSWTEYGVNLNAPYFIVIVVKIDFYENVLSGPWSKDIHLLQFAILNIACELLDNIKANTEGIGNGNDYVTILLNIDSEIDDIFEKVNSIMKKLQDNVNKYLGILITVGIGDIVEEIDSISDSFQNALTASKYRLVFGRKSIIQYADIAEQNARDFHEYPYSIEKQIIKRINGLNLEKTDESLSEFFETLSSYNADEILISAIQLSVSLTKTLSNLAKTSIENGDYNIKTLFLKIQACETMEDIRKHFYSLCSEIILSKNTDLENNSKIILITKIKNYVYENFADINISPDSIADYVGLSCNYVRAIFKEVNGVSLSNFITECRLLEAKKLLIHTDYPVKKIAELTGYTENSKHFYTIFKRWFGQTPEMYRNAKRINVN